jgi:hypothetical protein
LVVEKTFGQIDLPVDRMNATSAIAQYLDSVPPAPGPQKGARPIKRPDGLGRPVAFAAIAFG